MIKKRYLFIVSIAALLVSGFAASVAMLTFDGREPDDCTLEFLGNSRKSVKNRIRRDAERYTVFNEGNSISIEEWLHWTARLDSLAPRNVEEIPEESPIEGAETFEVTLEGYLVAWKYEHSNSIFEKDNDFHLEIASSPDWNSDHVIVEVPPGPNYCDARRTAWALVQSDARKAGTSIGSTIHLFQSPVKVLVRGYVFLDATHGQPCDEDNQSFSSCNGGRGIKVRGPSQVKGLWELHPVVALIPID